MNLKIKTRLEFIRIAGLFALPENSKHPGVKRITPSEYILIEPMGSGVRVVSTDGSAVCVQVDRKGYADRPYLIKVPDGLRGRFEGENINEYELVVCHEGISRILGPVGLVPDTPEILLIPAHVYGNGEPDTDSALTVPNWPEHIPSKQGLADLERGLPATVDSHYMRLIGHMYDDMPDCRLIEVSHQGGDIGCVYLQFPWRPEMVVVLPYPDTGKFDAVTALGDIFYPATDDPAAGL